MVLSIVVPTYNVESYLANCLESLLNQDIPVRDYEIIVINDGATDASPEIAHSYAQRYSQIKVVSQHNQGLSAARNHGIQLAQGKYIYLIDSDDYLAYNTLGYAIRMMEILGLDLLGLGVMNTPRLDIWEAKNREVLDREELKVTDGISFIAENRYLNNAWWYIMRKEFLLETGLTFPVGRYFEDCVFTATLLASCKRIAQSKLDFYRYVIRPNSITQNRNKDHSMRLIADYEKNVFEFEPLLDKIRNSGHVEAEPCILRLEARQQSFIFFMFVMCIRNMLTRVEVSPIIERLASFDAYPIKESFIKDYPNKSYPYMRFVMNRRRLFYVSLRILPLLQKFIPKIYQSVNSLVRSTSR